jgi:hypothetical protein
LFLLRESCHCSDGDNSWDGKNAFENHFCVYLVNNAIAVMGITAIVVKGTTVGMVKMHLKIILSPGFHQS